MQKILILTNDSKGLYNFRKELIEGLIEKKFKIYICLPYGDEIEYFKKIGCEFIEVKINRRGHNLSQDLRLCVNYFNAIKKIKPNFLLTFTIKPNLYGGLVSRMFKDINFFAHIAGLGTPFQHNGLVSKLLIVANKVALKKSKRVFFENSLAENFYIDNKIVSRNSMKLSGAGVNLLEYSFTTYPEISNNLRLLFIGRIMREKGIRELFEVAKKVKEKYNNVTFEVIGPLEEDFQKQIDRYEKEKIINYHGFVNDTINFYKGCHCLILPSYHEGMANVLLEASAIGRPVITSNISGCKEAVIDNVTGYLCEVKSSESLYEKVMNFIELSFVEKEKMGIEARRLVEREFNRSNVVKIMINEIENNKRN